MATNQKRSLKMIAIAGCLLLIGPVLFYTDNKMIIGTPLISITCLTAVVLLVVSMVFWSKEL